MAATVRNAFKDYIVGGNILDCSVDNVNLYKKSQMIEIELSSEKVISASELKQFEEYLKNKFQINKANISIKQNVIEAKVTRREIFTKE